MASFVCQKVLWHDELPEIDINDALLEGKEIKRVKNIEIPDAIKELEYKGFKFDVPMSGAITFKIYFEPGTLPETWPEPRQRKSRTPKADPEPDARRTGPGRCSGPHRRFGAGPGRRPAGG